MIDIDGKKVWLKEHDVYKRGNVSEIIDNPELAEAMRYFLFTSWARYWDLNKGVLVEKSPTNMGAVC